MAPTSLLLLTLLGVSLLDTALAKDFGLFVLCEKEYGGGKPVLKLYTSSYRMYASTYDGGSRRKVYAATSEGSSVDLSKDKNHASRIKATGWLKNFYLDMFAFGDDGQLEVVQCKDKSCSSDKKEETYPVSYMFPFRAHFKTSARRRLTSCSRRTVRV